MRIFLEGTYGIGNFGDDLLARISRDFIESAGHDVIIAGSITKMRQFSAPVISVGRLDVKSKIYEIRRADAVVIGGGGQFNDNSSRTGGAHLVLTFMISALLGRPVFVAATGFGPLRRPFARSLWRFLGSRRQAMFAFREQYAQLNFKELTGRDSALVGDLALSNFGRGLVMRLAGDRTPEGVALVNLRNYRRNIQVEQVILKTMIEEGYRLEGLMADAHDDVNLVGLREHGIERCNDYGGIEDFLQAIVKAEAVLTQRFHVLLVCALLGVPVVALVYAEKMRDFCEWVGLPYVTVEDTNPEDISNATRAALRAGPIDLSLLSARIDPLSWLEKIAWRT